MALVMKTCSDVSAPVCSMRHLPERLRGRVAYEDVQPSNKRQNKIQIMAKQRDWALKSGGPMYESGMLFFLMIC